MCRVMETAHSPLLLLSLPEKNYCPTSLGKLLVWKGLETKYKWADDAKIHCILSLLEPFLISVFFAKTTYTVTHTYRFV